MQAFVMMPFDTSFREIREAIRTAANSIGVYCVWVDENLLTGKITDQIESEIRMSNFCICDITGKNANVSWECGFSRALGKKIVLLSQSEKDLFFDIKDQRTIIYDPNNLRDLIQNLKISLNIIKQSSESLAPELLVGTHLHEKMRTIAAAKSINDTPYNLFTLIERAQNHIFIAGQNNYQILHSVKNKNLFETKVIDLLKKSDSSQVDIMISDETCAHAIKTWEYVQDTTKFLDHLHEITLYFIEFKNKLARETTFGERFVVKKIDFVPLSVQFVDPESPEGLAVIIPNSFQKVNNARPCYIMSRNQNAEILHEYWSIYYHWFTSMTAQKL